MDTGVAKFVARAFWIHTGSWMEASQNDSASADGEEIKSRPKTAGSSSAIRWLRTNCHPNRKPASPTLQAHGVPTPSLPLLSELSCGELPRTSFDRSHHLREFQGFFPAMFGACRPDLETSPTDVAAGSRTQDLWIVSQALHRGQATSHRLAQREDPPHPRLPPSRCCPTR